MIFAKRRLAATLLTALAFMILANSDGLSQNPNSPPRDLNKGPIADSTQYLADGAKDRSRQVEHNNHPGAEEIKELPAGVSRLPEIWDQIGELGALPVKDADAIFVAEVTKNAALLSADRTSVFSTFGVKVSQVLLNHLGEAIRVGGIAELERYGGRVKYPDGKTEEVNVDGRYYPNVGSTYIFFVEQTPKRERWTSGNAEGLNIITAYEVKDGKIYAMDRAHNPGALPYEKYDGTPEESFLSIVTAQIKQESTKPLGGAL